MITADKITCAIPKPGDIQVVCEISSPYDWNELWSMLATVGATVLALSLAVISLFGLLKAKRDASKAERKRLFNLNVERIVYCLNRVQEALPKIDKKSYTILLVSFQHIINKTDSDMEQKMLFAIWESLSNLVETAEEIDRYRNASEEQKIAPALRARAEKLVDNTFAEMVISIRDDLNFVTMGDETAVDRATIQNLVDTYVNLTQGYAPQKNEITTTIGGLYQKDLDSSPTSE